VTKGERRLYELDLLRVVAATSVLLFHYTYRGGRGGRGLAPYIPYRFPEIDAVTRYGFLGVQLFFFISGMVILRSASGVKVRQFIASRASRIYPAYWVLVTVTAAVVVWSGLSEVGVRQFLVNLTMLQKFLHVDEIDGAYWTLAVELRFYVLMGLAIATGLVRHIRLVLPLWLVVVGVLGRLDVPDSVALVTLTDYAPYFIAGCCCHLLRERARDPLVWATLVGAAVLSCERSMHRASVNVADYGDASNRTVAVIVTLVALGLVLAVALGFTERFGRPWMLVAGALTYPLYLAHEDLGYVALRHLGPVVGRWAAVVIVTAGAVGVAWLVHRVIEEPLGPRMRRLVLRVLRAQKVDPDPSPVGMPG